MVYERIIPILSLSLVSEINITNKATEVHHKKYARVNIGREPIEWLVSICRGCHQEIHS